jgi:integrase family protein
VINVGISKVQVSHVEQFIEYLSKVRNLSENTLRSYQTDLLAFEQWCSREGVEVAKVNHRNLRLYLAYLKQAQYSTKTLNRHLSALRCFYKWMQREKLIATDPALALSNPRAPRNLPHTMTDSDVNRLLESCDTSTAVGLRDRAFLEFLYATGARISEVATLKLEQIDLQNGTVRLFGKGSKERIVPLYESAIEWLKKYLRSSRPTLLLKDKSGRAHSALFISVRGNDMSADSLRKVFSSYLVAAGLDSSLSPHAMRHTYATELLGGGADLRIVQELLGHESLSTTQVYTHLSVDRLKEAAKAAHPRSK